MPIYVVLKKRKEAGIFLPNFESYAEKPELLEEKWKLLTLEPGDCVDVGKFTMSPDFQYVSVRQFRVSNLDGNLVETLTDSYTLPRWGHEKNDSAEGRIQIGRAHV